MDDGFIKRWYDENRGDRIYHSSFSGYFKLKAIQVAKLYITGKTNWNLAGDDLNDQAEVMYQNTRFLARGFCVRHFKQKKNTDFLISQLSRRDSDHYARQLDYAVMRSLEETDEDDMANALLPLHMAMDFWLALWWSDLINYTSLSFTFQIPYISLPSESLIMKHDPDMFPRTEIIIWNWISKNFHN